MAVIFFVFFLIDVFFLHQFWSGLIAVLFYALIAAALVPGVNEVFRSSKCSKLDLLLLSDVEIGEIQADFLVEIHGCRVVSAHIELQMAWVIREHVFYEFTANSLSLTVCFDRNAHEVASLRGLWLLDSSSSLLVYLLLHHLFRWVLREEGSIADDSLSVGLASNYDFVDV